MNGCMFIYHKYKIWMVFVSTIIYRDGTNCRVFFFRAEHVKCDERVLYVNMIMIRRVCKDSIGARPFRVLCEPKIIFNLLFDLTEWVLGERIRCPL